MTEENKPKKKKSLFKKVIKKIKLSHLVVLVVLLAVNSYAWFIFVNTVSTDVGVHVRSWKIDVVDENDVVTDYVTVEVDSIYPGMTTFSEQIQAYNYGEVDATISYKVLEATILGTTTVTQEGKTDLGQTPTGTEPTSAQLISQLANDYPFHITFGLSHDSIQAGNGVESFTVTVSWAYESGDDVADTEWGVDAYDYTQAHPGAPCITLRVKVYITQAND